MPSEESDGEVQQMFDELDDPSNYEFMETPNGEKVHIVGTGLPTSILVRGGRAMGDYGPEDEKAICGTVSAFQSAEDVPTEIDEAMDRICTRCVRQSYRIRGRGKFSEVPL